MENLLDALINSGCEIDKSYYLNAVKQYKNKEELELEINTYIDTFIKTNPYQIKDVSVALLTDKTSYFHNFQENTLYDLASITKLFTLKGVYDLRKENRIVFEQPICTYLEGCKGLQNYTVLDAIKMFGIIETEGKLSETKDYETFRKVLKTVKVKEYSEETTTYTDIGHVLLGNIIEKVTNKDLKTYFKEDIFDKYHMENTLFLPSHDYILKGNGNTFYLPHDLKTRVAHGMTGAAGLFSNVYDLSKFAKELWNGHVFDSGFLKEIYDYTFIDTINRNRSFSGLYKKTKGYRSYVPKEFSDFALAHQGFTGSVFVVDLKLHMGEILLFDAIPNGEEKKHPDFLKGFYVFRDKMTTYLILLYLMQMG